MVVLAQLLHKVGKWKLPDQEIQGFLVPLYFLEGCSPQAMLLWPALTLSSLTLVLVTFPLACTLISSVAPLYSPAVLGPGHLLPSMSLPLSCLE